MKLISAFCMAMLLLVSEAYAADTPTERVASCENKNEVLAILCDRDFMTDAGLSDHYVLYTEAFSETERQTIALEILNSVKHGNALTEAFKTAVLGVLVPDTTRGRILAFEASYREPEWDSAEYRYETNTNTDNTEIRYIYSDVTETYLKRGWNRLVTVNKPEGKRTIVNSKIIDEDMSGSFPAAEVLTVIQYNQPVLYNTAIVQDSETKSFIVSTDYSDPSMQAPIYSVKWYVDGELRAESDQLIYTPMQQDVGREFTAVISASNIYGMTTNETAVSIQETQLERLPVYCDIIQLDGKAEITIKNDTELDYNVYIALYDKEGILQRVIVEPKESITELKTISVETVGVGCIKCMAWDGMIPIIKPTKQYINN